MSLNRDTESRRKWNFKFTGKGDNFKAYEESLRSFLNNENPHLECVLDGKYPFDARMRKKETLMAKMYTYNKAMARIIKADGLDDDSSDDERVGEPTLNKLWIPQPTHLSAQPGHMRA